ncbi:MAG: oligosaccharide flippase family protein [Candidatus Aenigmarchaeota archaeon]|nr:oligosaccharide flippase family protein [Candidatus Aenigmarchaeota archaeon]
MKKNIFKALAGTFISNGCIIFCGFITGILTARLLLPEGRGALAAVLYWPQIIAGIGLLSIHEAVTYRVGRDPDRRRKIVSSALWLALFLSIILSISGYLTIPWLLGLKRQELWSISRFYVLLYVPFNFVILTLFALDHGLMRFSQYNIFRLSVPLLYLSGILLLWFTGHVSVGMVVFVNLLSTVIVALVRMFMSGTELFMKPDFSEIWRLVKDALSFHGAAILVIAASQIDKFVVLKLWDNEFLGIYIVGLTVASSGLNMVGSTFHIVLFPSIAGSSQDQQYKKLTEGIRQAMFMLFFIAVPLMLLAPYFVPFLFGYQFTPAGILAVYLLMAYSLVSLKTIVIRSLRGFGEGLPGTIAELTALLLFLASVWPLSMQFGMIGVALALIFGNCGALLYLGIYLVQKHGVELRELWGLTPLTARQFYRALILYFQGQASDTKAR